MRDGAVSAVRISNFKNEQPSKNFEIQVLAYDIVFEVAKNVNPRESPCPRVQISNLCNSYSAGVVVSNSSSAILKFDFEFEVAKNANPRGIWWRSPLQQGVQSKTPVP